MSASKRPASGLARPAKKRPAVSLVPCPVCRRQIPSFRLQVHASACEDFRADGEPRLAAGPRAPAPIEVPGVGEAQAHPTLVGQYLIPNFVSPAEEAAILSWLGRPGERECAPAWRLREFNGRAYGKAWGVRTDLRARTQMVPAHPMPSQLRAVASRMGEAVRAVTGTAGWRPTEANAILYRRQEGHSLTAHVDDRALSGDVLCNLCLAGSAVMTYTREQGDARPPQQAVGLSRPRALPRSERVPLPRYALQIQTKACRFEYAHAIDNADLVDGERVSITFRQGAFVPHGGAAAVWEADCVAEPGATSAARAGRASAGPKA
mmetsp:Transcript_2872/g.9390  ORF Transcript_2872/g.9390 Transcript_2872/m.9390 type:complete len:321 (-) Transcript_2872:86-1048(-)